MWINDKTFHASYFKKHLKKSSFFINCGTQGKLLFGVGLGVFLVTYFQDYFKDLYWLFFGGILIIISLILHIPSWYKTFKNI